MKAEFHFARACRFWGYRPHELERRKDKDFLIAQAGMLESAENLATEVARKVAEQRERTKL